MPGVLYDGWDLAYHPNSPAALHLLTLLAAQPAGIEPLVALPERSFHALGEGIQVHLEITPSSPSGKLRWEQGSLPGIAHKLSADLIHTSGGAALFGRQRVAFSPAGPPWKGGHLQAGDERPVLNTRLGQALGEGGLARLGILFWPSDLEGLSGGWSGDLPHRLLPPVVHPAFLKGSVSPDEKTLSELDLPQTFILYHGSGKLASLHRLMAAWSWAAASIGEYYPLLAVGMSRLECDHFLAAAREYRLEGSLRCLPDLPIAGLAALYRASSAVFHPEDPSPWGGPLRQGLACGKPLVGLESRLSDAILGAAGYLIKEGGTEAQQSRALGAALITVIVEEGVAEALSNAARQRAAGYSFERFSIELAEAYHILTA